MTDYQHKQICDFVRYAWSGYTYIHYGTYMYMNMYPNSQAYIANCLQHTC